ncbi:uncharacterized protein LOC105836975 [Monomorium pharaonis]|uniref:uncharacterized protein LOC105836975 n=1 Tax=Monomorium pharaonis TaxID=307658 RepID=UPI00063F925B|nr:uncharacterized protein LOC105836975 [Monomorium pharaonis]
MRRSPMNSAAHGGRPSYGAKHMPYSNWKSPGYGGRGYPSSAQDNDRQSFPASSPIASQPCDGDFIPLDVSTPTTRHEKPFYNVANRYSPSGGGTRGSPGGGWHSFRGSSPYYNSPRSNRGNRYPVYQHSPKFSGQKRKGYKGVNRQVNVSAYVDMNSFLEDPWEELVKKLGNSKDISKSERSESESNSELIDLTESKLSKDTNLDELQCSQECKNEHSVDVKEQNIDLCQMSKVNSSVKSDLDDTCSDQDSPNESMCSVSDKSFVEEK